MNAMSKPILEPDALDGGQAHVGPLAGAPLHD